MFGDCPSYGYWKEKGKYALKRYWIKRKIDLQKPDEMVWKHQGKVSALSQVQNYE